MLSLACTVLLVAILWPMKKPEGKALPQKNEILGVLQEQSQIATTEVTIRKMGTTLIYSYSNYDIYAADNFKFSDRDYYHPIPWSEIKYQGIEQNPGWTEV